MKILISGSDHEAAMEQYYTRYFAELGISNTLFPAQGIFYQYYNSGVFQKVLFKLHVSGIYREINDRLMEVVANDKPDVLLVFKGMEIFPKTLKNLKARGIKLVNYNPDNPFLFSGSGSGNKNVTGAIRQFDLYVTYDRTIAKRLEENGVKAAIIPFGFEVSEEQVSICSKEPEVNKLCFLGNPDKERADFLNRLAKRDLPIDVYGSNWHRFNMQKNIQLFDAVYGIEFWKVLRKYRVQLNLMRPHNLHSHNMRSIEVPGVGGIGLFPDTPDHATFFENGSEIYLYKNVEDCTAVANKLLSLTREEALGIRKRARERSIRSGYSYRNRAEQLAKYLDQLI